ncbi:DNA topoisomerase 1 isoform X1 [Coffea arabica]|uniref:DNA topoisomerase I n=2 Tax=Coffea arabica TaxID=13443 RepID=A0A6P6XMG8_COFAR|nr:DNA topoisomerase 1-like isoform X1 [Coffea arabica]
MAVEACSTPSLLEDSDEENAPLVFKRTSSSSKQNLSNSDTKKLSSQKRDGQSSRNSSDVCPVNGQSSSAQTGRVVSSAKTPPAKSPLSSPKAANISAKTSLITSPGANSKPSSSTSATVKQLENHKNSPVVKLPKPSVPAAKPSSTPVDSDDDKPLMAKLPSGSSRAIVNHGNKDGDGSSLVQKPGVEEDEDSDDEKPLSSRYSSKSKLVESISKTRNPGEKKTLPAKVQQNGSALRDGPVGKSSSLSNKRPPGEVKSSDESAVKKPKLSGPTAAINKKQAMLKAEPKVEDNDDDILISQTAKKTFASASKPKSNDDDDDHVPITQRMKKSTTSVSQSSSVKKVAKVVSSSLKKTNKKSKKIIKKSKYSKSSKVPPGSGEGQKWTTLVHNGVIFPPPYKPHGVKMLYKGQPVTLTPEQEEVATMFAVMLDTDYMSKPQFKENFFSDWKKILGKNHTIQNLENCDFRPIYEWHQKEKEKKKQMTTEEKKSLKEEKLKQEEKYMWAIVDGVKEKVGNFRVEPPGLFRGRGEHPKMGKLKKRIRPRDITINIGKDAPIPECPIRGERWKEIRHDNTVTWLAFWNDPINPKEFKYVFLAASSTLKGQSDKEKYEKARLLKDYIHGIRTAYTKDFASKDPMKKQIAVATYLIDKLALRAGNEKDDDEADTVGCCTLKVENVEPVPPNILKFDFLGKDSIRYQNEVEVESGVFKAIQQFRSGKEGSEDLFDKLDTSKLNAHLKELMPGLTAKVFRTYNASITLDDMLSRKTNGGDVLEKVVVYQQANKEVAIICNHQRTVSKTHSAQMSRLNEKIEELKGVLEELKTDLSRAKKGKPPLKNADGKPKRNLNPEALERKIAQTNAKIEKMERDKETKEDLKTVALGTSKINYLDPRITVAWCKRHEVPIEKIFNKSLLAKFAWSMDVDPSFRF